MDAKRRKTLDATKEDCEGNTIVRDRISYLPDSLIDYILSFLPTIFAVRTSILSKRWRYIWVSVPSLEFYDYSLEKYSSCRTERKKFFNFVDDCFEHHKRFSPYTDTILTRFKLIMRHYGGNNRVDRWLSQCLKSNVKELDLSIQPHPKTVFYSLPQFVFSSTSLHVLKLDTLKLDILLPVSLPSLTTMSFLSVQVDDKTLHRLILGCPSLRKLGVYSYYYNLTALVNPQISSSSLRCLEIERTCEGIHFEASKLQSFVYSGHDEACSMNLASCTALVHLTLNHTSFSDEWIEDLLLSVPLLESLTLNGCSGFKQLNISNQRLKCIVLRSTRENRNISLDTPNLVSLTFEGCVCVNFSMKAPSLMKANLKLIHFSKYSIKDWFLDLINFIKHFDCSRSLSLHVWPQKALIIPKTLRKKCNPPLPNLKHLKVWIQDRDGPLKEAKLRDSMLWCAPSVEALLVEQGHNCPWFYWHI